MIATDTNLDTPILENSLHLNIQESLSDKWLQARNILAASSEVFFSPNNRSKLFQVTCLTGGLILQRYGSAYLIGKIIQDLSGQSNITKIGQFCMSRSALLTSYLALTIIGPFASILQNRICEKIQWNVMEEIMKKSVYHFLDRPLDFHLQNSVTDMFQLIQKAFPLQRVGISILTDIFPTFLETVISSCILSIQFGPVVGSSLLILELLFIGYSFQRSKAVLSIKESTNAAWNDTFQKIGEVLFYYKLMRDCNHTEKSKKAVHEVLENLKEIDLSASNISSDTQLGYHILSSLHLILIGSYIGMNSTKFTPQSIIALISYLSSFASLLPRVGHGITTICSNYADLKEVFSKLQMPSGIMDPYPNVALKSVNAPEISFENVQFQYPAKEGLLLTDLSFKIPAGKKVALVSKSGAGKTSIFHLLYRYFSPSTGLIKIADQDIQKVGIDSLQSQISVIGQSAILINGTLRDNILYGAQDPSAVSDLDIFDLAKKIGCESLFQELPFGLDTKIGEGGKTVSGGQGQKIAILRSLFKSTKIRLLDEVTASLDGISAAKILEFLLDKNQDVTTIFITHKLVEAQKADHILFLENGKISSQGSHIELMQGCPSYMALYNAQQFQN